MNVKQHVYSLMLTGLFLGQQPVAFCSTGYSLYAIPPALTIENTQPADTDTNKLYGPPADTVQHGILVAGNPNPAETGIILKTDKIREKNVQLNWEITQDSINEIYELQRSPNGVIWQTIKSRQVKTDDTNQEAFNYLDNEPDMPFSYYRLRLVKADGSSVYSQITSVSFTEFNSISIMPNPARNFASMNLFAMKDGKAVVQVLDVNGRLKCNETVLVHEGDNEFYLALLRKLGKGVYTIRVVINEEVLTHSLVVLK